MEDHPEADEEVIVTPVMDPTTVFYIYLDPYLASYVANTITSSCLMISHPAPPRPNCRPLYSVTAPRAVNHDTAFPSAGMTLHLAAWMQALSRYPCPVTSQMICTIIANGAKVGYCGPKQLVFSKNLRSATSDRTTLQQSIQADLATHRSRLVNRTDLEYFFSSPLGLVPKGDDGKTFRRIHHLSFEPKHQGPGPRVALAPSTSAAPSTSPTPALSVNGGIPPSWGSLDYATFDEIIATVSAMGAGTYIIKRDWASAFRHIPVHPDDQWLLGYQWMGQHFQELFLPFGLRTAPLIFNFFAEALHWILESRCNELPEAHRPTIFHYLDDTIFIFPPAAPKSTIEWVICMYTEVTDALGIQRNDKKDVEGTAAEVLGIVVDTLAMELRLSPTKLRKTRRLLASCFSLLDSTVSTSDPSIPLVDLQELTGFLNFCSKAVPLGRTFLRRLWQAQTGHPSLRIPISPPMIADLHWWASFLNSWKGVSLLRDHSTRPHHVFYGDASGSIAIGGYTLEPSQSSLLKLRIDQIYWSRAEHVLEEDIAVKELRAIDLAIRLWGQRWRGAHLTIYTDNRIAFYGLDSKTTRSIEGMEVLRAILLQLAAFDTSYEVVWIASAVNSFADALSRLNFQYIADVAPQLSQVLPPTSSPTMADYPLTIPKPSLQ